MKKLIYDQDPDIIQLTEVIPKNIKNPINFDVEFQLDGYNLYYNKDKSPRRGVIVYIKNTIDAKLCEPLNSVEFEECVWCTIKHNSISILLGCIYKSPSDNEAESTDKLVNMLLKTEDISKDKIIVTGDFNFPNINWVSGLPDPNCTSKFAECIQDLFLSQIIIEPTRHRSNEKSNILDLCLTDDELLFINNEHLPPLGKSDHEVLLMRLDLPKPTHETKAPRYNFFKTDIPKFRDFLLNNNDWSTFIEMNPNESWDIFQNKLQEGFQKYVPKTSSKITKKQPLWFNNKFLKSLRKKYLLFKRFKQTNTHYDYQKYIEARNLSKKAIRKSVKEYEKKVCNDSKTKPKQFWKYVNTKLKRSTGISNLKMNQKGDLTSNDQEKANTLNNFFSSVFTKEKTDTIPKLDDRNKGIFFSELILTREAISKKLSNLNPSKAMGPDGILSFILKTFSEELSLPLLYIFNKSLSEGVVPEAWKLAEVTAIFKKGDKTEPGNYRPVSLTSITCKILESLVCDALREYLEANNMLSKCQHGFRKHRSCVTKLLEVLNDLTKLHENNESIDIIYLDFAKAFDTVPHLRLLEKLKAYGITGNVLNWISSFLSERKQRVRVNSTCSNTVPVQSGVPQGSILGPLLFIVFINDLPDCVESICKIFADDTEIYDSSANHQQIQLDLLALLKWSELWQLFFNVTKCSVLYHGKNNKKEDYFTDCNFKVRLKETFLEKNVGVTFSKDLKFNEHINNVVSKANQITGIVKRSFEYLDNEMFLKLYKSIIRPHLEYANVVWHPMYQHQKHNLEAVQRRATKMIPNLKDKKYPERLRLLKLPSIKYRQLRGDLIQSFKIITNIDNVNCSDFFKIRDSSNTRNSYLKLYKEYAKTLPRTNFLPNRINTVWNNLSLHTKSSNNVQQFKNRVDLELSSLHYDFYN